MANVLKFQFVCLSCGPILATVRTSGLNSLREEECDVLFIKIMRRACVALQATVENIRDFV